MASGVNSAATIVRAPNFAPSTSTEMISKSENRFARADLEHTLLCVDDDMRMEALRQTNYVKSIVTAQGQMDLERKGKQSVFHAKQWQRK